MQKLLGLGLMAAAVAGNCFAGLTAAPEIDGSSAGAAIALIAGAMLIIRSRKRK